MVNKMRIIHEKVSRKIFVLALILALAMSLCLTEYAYSKVTGLKLSKKNVTVRQGYKMSIKFKATDRVKANSRNKKIATVKIKRNYVVITARKAGKVKIKVTCKKLVKYITVRVVSRKNTAMKPLSTASSINAVVRPNSSMSTSIPATAVFPTSAVDVPGTDGCVHSTMVP